MTASCPFALAPFNATRTIDDKSPMMEITTRSSMRVKPRVIVENFFMKRI
jgi:hypothetical protein